MPLITYGGHKVVIDSAYSLARVSSPIQFDGEGLDRQMRRSRDWSETYAVPIDQEFTVTASASKGYHIRKGKELAALGVFLEAVEARKLKPNPVLLVESFSRLSRLPILDAVDVFRQIVNRGCALITLTSTRVYTKAIIDRDPGMMHTVLAELQSARTEAESKSDYSRWGYAKRRGKPSKVCPGWLRLKDDRSGYYVILGAEPILLRIFLESEYLGVDQIAARLNADNIPLFNSWNLRKPGRCIWYNSYIAKIIRSRAVLGEIEVHEYGWKLRREIDDDGKAIEYQRWERHTTGRFETQYPAIELISEDQWLRSNAALDARKTGRGPKGEGFANLFQGIAKCAHCVNGSMKLLSTAKARRGRPLKRYHYYRCVNSQRQACDNSMIYDYAKVESEFIDVFADMVAAYLASAEPQMNRLTPLREKIATKQAELFRLDERAKSIEVSLLEAQRQDGSSHDEITRLRENLGINRKKGGYLGGDRRSRTDARSSQSAIAVRSGGGADPRSRKIARHGSSI